MKIAGLLFLMCVCAAGQAPTAAKVIRFDPSDAEHCKATTIRGRQMLETVFGGTSVAVGAPVSTVRGDFRVFVVIRQIGPGKTDVRPKGFFALYSDAAHTRFPFYNKAGEILEHGGDESAQDRGIAGADQADPGTRPGFNGRVTSNGIVRPPSILSNTKTPDPGSTDVMPDGMDQQGTAPGTRVTPEQLYLGRKTLRPGKSTQGMVYFRKPKHSNLHVGPQDRLFEIDLPVNGVVYRFN